MSVKPDAIAGRLPELVQLDELRVGEYQREPVASWVASLVESWDDDACDPLKVARRANGHLFTVDGNHRRLAALELGFSHIYATIYDLESQIGTEAEAAEFVRLNTWRKNPDAGDLHVSRLAFNEGIAQSIEEILRERNMTAVKGLGVKNPSPGKLGEVRAVNACRVVLRDFTGSDATDPVGPGPAALGWSLDVIRAWTDTRTDKAQQHIYAQSMMLRCLGWVGRTYGTEIDPADVGVRLSALTDVEFKARIAHGVMTSSQAHRKHARRLAEYVNGQHSALLDPERL